jgi:hypothetical protein
MHDPLSIISEAGSKLCNLGTSYWLYAVIGVGVIIVLVIVRLVMQHV